MSVKERIAMMKLKEEEEKASKSQVKTPEPPVRRTSIISTVNGIPPPPSVAQNRVFEADLVPESSEKDVSIGKISIADRLAALKASNGASLSSQKPDVESNVSFDISGSAPISSVSERMAVLRRKSVGPVDAFSPPPPPPLSSVSSVPDEGNSGVALSVSERMAALRAASTSVDPAKAPLFRSPSSSATSMPSATSASKTDDQDCVNDQTPPQKLTIAERMAALKASAENPSTPVTNAGAGGSSSVITPSSGGVRRLSVGLAGLGAKINLAALSPNAVRPPMPKKELDAEVSNGAEDEESTSPKNNKVSFSGQEDGEFRHVSLRTFTLHS